MTRNIKKLEDKMEAVRRLNERETKLISNDEVGKQ